MNRPKKRALVQTVAQNSGTPKKSSKKSISSRVLCAELVETHLNAEPTTVKKLAINKKLTIGSQPKTAAARGATRRPLPLGVDALVVVW